MHDEEPHDTGGRRARAGRQANGGPRVVLCVIAVLLFVAGRPPSAQSQGQPPGAEDGDQRPNIVLIMADDLGYSDLGSYGGVGIDTPHLDRLADRGLRFTQFYNTGKCGPSRAELLSGRYWHSNTLYWNHGDNAPSWSWAYDSTKTASTPPVERNSVTIAEVLDQAGYHTMMVGKWHLSGTPSTRGFERSFGFLNGAINYFTGVGTAGQTDVWRLNGAPYEVPETDFYATHAFTDRSVEFVEAADTNDEQPFFLYLSYNAPHYPLQAPAETVEKYRRRFAAGWDSLRQARHQRQRQLGLVPDRWTPAPINATTAPQYPRIPQWSDLSMERKWSEDLKMATYAAMVEEMDRGIGRLMTRLEALGEADNTLVLFLSDNGACPFVRSRTPQVPPGPAASFHNYDTPWANLSNMPFRGYKRQAFEGGVSTPFIVSWPEGIAPGRRGDRTRQVGHVTDVMPTLLAAAEASYPRRFGGRAVEPGAGRSLLPVIEEGARVDRTEPLFWSFKRNAAVRMGRYKLVARRTEPWRLYDMQADRTETTDLSDQRPETRAELRRRYHEWAERAGVDAPHRTDTQ